MDALSRADETLARAQARRDEVVTPDSATSPMDQENTVQIPRVTVDDADPGVAGPPIPPPPAAGMIAQALNGPDDLDEGFGPRRARR